MHLIEPTSCSVTKDNNSPITVFSPVSSPGDKTDEPLKRLTSTFSPANVANPTSKLASTGSPIKGVELPGAVKRTNLPQVDIVSIEEVEKDLLIEILVEFVLVVIEIDFVNNLNIMKL